MRDDELKRCPHCGGKAVMCRESELSHFVTCESYDCEARTLSATSRAEAAKAWNRRAYESLEATILEYRMRGYSRAECLTAIERGMGI